MEIVENIKIPDSIKFTVLSPTEIRKYSVLEITQPETYDEDGMPVPGGLMDNRLGTLEPGQKCATCGNTAARCPGHFGHIELAEPVLHVSFVDEIHKLLVATCRSCGRIKLHEEEIRKFKEEIEKASILGGFKVEKIRKELISKCKKVKICPHCGKPQFEIEFISPTIFHEITEDGGATRLLPSVIRERLARIPDEDVEILGLNPKTARPEWLVLTVLLVPPVYVRPSIILETGIRSEDDLTHKIVDILRVNQRLKESKESGTPPLIVQDLVDLLQYHVTTYFDNEVSGIPQAHHRSGRPLVTLSQRLKGKEGRFRGSLSGKRVDFSSRTVISPDPNLDISEVGVPLEVAKKLTVPEKVSPWNIDLLRELVIRGPKEHPGANYVIRPDGVKIRLDYVTDRVSLANSLTIGYTVERHLMDGDIVIFNRQPSLHRMSIMAHFVKVLPYRTFRLHPAVCPPYNADFDGDEMNLHVPQSEEARSEAFMLMRVHDQILSPRYGGPIIGAIRDFITAAYLLTKDDTFLTKEEFADLAYRGGYRGKLPEPIVKEPKPLYSGKQLVSLFLPKGFNYVMSSKWNKSRGEKNDLIIKDGQMISGVLDKASIGAEEPDSMLHRIAKDYGTEEARRFLNSLLAILTEYISRRGFSYGFDELELPREVKDKIKDIIYQQYNKVFDLIDKYKKGLLEPIKGLTLEESLEQRILTELARARDEAGKLADHNLSLNNAGIIMARTGARGSNLNIGQMTACLGQQSVRGQRIKKGYYRRALSHFEKGDPNPDASGFIKSSYRDGLNPLEFFFHAMGGREGLVDTAVRTQQSGYMQRRLVNAMEHLRVEYDLTVRDPEGNIIQFLYGEDGIHPAKSDHGKAVNVERLVEVEAIVGEKGERVNRKKVEEILKNYEDKLNKKILEELREALLKVPLKVESIRRVCERTVELVEKAKVEPGEAIGVVAAQSIGEPGTQMTLRTFHFAGVRERDVTLGLPRLIELVDARRKPSTPYMEIFLDEEHRSSREKAEEVAKEILFTKVEDLIEEAYIDYDNLTLVLKLSEQKLKNRGCEVKMVEEAIKTSKLSISLEGNTLYVRQEGLDIVGLINLKNKLLSKRVKGIPEIESITVRKRGEEWVIETRGSNLQKVLLIKGVDPTRTTTNNIFEIASVLGIEAARNALIKEIMSTLDEQGLEVDVRHVLLLADLMTSKGILQQVGRHGVTASKASPLARAAFEITVPTLAEAAIKGEVDKLKGVTENVIVGLPIPVGTGMIELYMGAKESG